MKVTSSVRAPHLRHVLLYVRSPTPDITITRIITSIAAGNDLELYSIDIEQAFLQTDKLMEGVNDRYFINPTDGSPDTNNKDIVYEVLRPSFGNPSSPRVLPTLNHGYLFQD